MMNSRFQKEVNAWEGVIQNVIVRSLPNNPQTFCFLCYTDHMTSQGLHSHYLKYHVDIGQFLKNPPTEKLPVVCWFCSKIFPDDYVLKKHVNGVHGFYLEYDPELFPIVNDWFVNDLTPPNLKNVPNQSAAAVLLTEMCPKNKSREKQPYMRLMDNKVRLFCGHGCQMMTGKLQRMAGHYLKCHKPDIQSNLDVSTSESS